MALLSMDTFPALKAFHCLTHRSANSWTAISLRMLLYKSALHHKFSEIFTMAALRSGILRCNVYYYSLPLNYWRFLLAAILGLSRSTTGCWTYATCSALKHNWMSQNCCCSLTSDHGIWKKSQYLLHSTRSFILGAWVCSLLNNFCINH